MKSIPLSVIEDRIAELNGNMREIQLELGMLDRLRMKATESATPAKPVQVATGQGKSTTTFIVELVRAEPGITASAVADRLKDVVKTNSEDPRRAVYNGTINLVNRGTLRRDESQGLYLIADAQRE